MFKTKKFWYITLFLSLYVIIGYSSFYHACSFFSLANNAWMSILLALAFEVGQAAVLFSLLTSSKDRGRVVPWVLMSMFTLVQILGNVFSSYKYLMLNSVEDLKYFKEPIFIWTDLPDNQATVIVVYLVGAILPLSALMLTSMITNYLSDDQENNVEKTIDNFENPKEDSHIINEQENETEEQKLEKSKKEVLKEKPRVRKERAIKFEPLIEEKPVQEFINEKTKEEIEQELEKEQQIQANKQYREEIVQEPKNEEIVQETIVEKTEELVKEKEVKEPKKEEQVQETIVEKTEEPVKEKEVKEPKKEEQIQETTVGKTEESVEKKEVKEPKKEEQVQETTVEKTEESQEEIVEEQVEEVKESKKEVQVQEQVEEKQEEPVQEKEKSRFINL